MVVTAQLSSQAEDMEAGYRQGFGAGMDNLAGMAERTMVLQRVIRAPRAWVWGAWMFWKSRMKVFSLPGWVRFRRESVCTAWSPASSLSTYIASSFGWSTPVCYFSATTSTFQPSRSKRRVNSLSGKPFIAASE